MEFEKIVKVISEQLGVEAEGLSEKTSFSEDLNADSLDLYQIILALEEEFEVEIPNEDAEKIKTIGDAVNYVKEKIA